MTVGPYQVAAINRGNSSACLNKFIVNCLRVEFVLRRKVSIALITAYFPSTLIVLISFLSFWVDNQLVPGRVSLVITSLLALMTQLLSIRNNIPAVSYLTALDVWFFICVSYVSSALFEFAIAHNLSKDVPKMYNDEPRLPLPFPQLSQKQHSQQSNLNHHLRKIFIGTRVNRWLHQHLDRASRVVFPTTFIIISSIYWAIYAT